MTKTASEKPVIKTATVIVPKGDRSPKRALSKAVLKALKNGAVVTEDREDDYTFECSEDDCVAIAAILNEIDPRADDPIDDITADD